MKKLPIIFCLFLFACGNSSDKSEVKIGNQIWMTKNLDVSTFRNGEIIPEAKTNEEWQEANKQKKPAWCYYDNDPENGKKYGKLYNGYAIADKRGLAPEGWHIPTLDEMELLKKNLGDRDNYEGVYRRQEDGALVDFNGTIQKENSSGVKIKSKSGWYYYRSVPIDEKSSRTETSKDGWDKKTDKNPNGTDSIGFNGLPGGEREGDGKFINIGIKGSWFFTDYVVFSDVDKDVGAYSLKNDDDEFGGHGEDGGWEGYSVRCIKDKTVENKGTNKNTSFDGVWTADPNSRVIYDGNRITDITITKNGENFLFVFNKNDLALKTMGTVDQSNNISLYGGQWLVALDVTDNDNLFLKGEIFHRVK